jgi:hypothetical protein
MTVPNISEFRAKLKYGGARPSLFTVTVTNPAVGGIDADLTFKCHAASLPAWSLTSIPVAYQGRSIKVAGNRSFADWGISIYNDEDFGTRDKFEIWSNAINSLEGNVRTFQTSEQSLYKSVAEVTQLSQTGQPLRTYKMNGIWPTTVGEIALEWSQEGQIQAFPVTFSLDYFYIGNSVTGNGGGL